MKTGSQLLLLFTVLLSTNLVLGQEKQSPEVIGNDKLVKKTEIRTHQVVQNSSNPEPVENTTGEPVFYSISNPSSFTVNTEAEVELTHEEKIAFIEEQITSVESKLFLLNEDPIQNEDEILEKEVVLELLKSELNVLKSE